MLIVNCSVQLLEEYPLQQEIQLLRLQVFQTDAIIVESQDRCITELDLKTQWRGNRDDLLVSYQYLNVQCFVAFAMNKKIVEMLCILILC